MNDQPPHTFDEAVRALLMREDGILGYVQVLCLPSGRWPDRIGSFFAHLLFLTENGRRVFGSILVVAPPGTDVIDARAKLAQAADSTFVRCGAEPDAGRTERLAACIEVVVANDLSAKGLLALLKGASPGRATAVARAADYRMSDLVKAPRLGASICGFSETWVPHLRWLTQALADRDEEADGFTLLDTGLFPPSEPQLAILGDVVGCAVLGMKPDVEDPTARVDARLPQWRIWIGEGHAGRAFQELDAIEGFHEDERRAVRVQLMDAAGMSQQALAELRQLPTSDMPPSISAKLARIATDAGATRLGRDLLAPIVNQLRNPEDLHNALHVVERADDDELTEIVIAALQRLFPSSPDLCAFQYQRAVAVGDHERAADLISTAPDGAEVAKLHRRLSDTLNRQVLPDYESIVQSDGGDDDSRMRALAICAADALRRGAVMHAFELCLDPAAVRADAGSQTLIATIEQLLINRPDKSLAVPVDRLADAVAVLIRRLARNPQNANLRSRLINLLDPATSGYDGLGIVLLLLVRAGMTPVASTPAPDLPRGPPLDDLIGDPAFSAAVDRWMARETPIQVGHTTFPLEELPITPDEACSSILEFIAFAAERGIPGDVGGPQDGTTMMLGLGTAIAPHASDPDIDIKMIRTAATGLALGGVRQAARDLAETMLLRPSTPRRRRLALIGLADVYHRCGDCVLSALYAVAGLAADDATDEDQFWHETLLIHRLLRDNGLTAQAISVIGSAERVLERMGRAERYGHRIETLHLQTRLSRLRDAKHPDIEIVELRAALVANAQKILEYRYTPGPVASMITQLNRLARERNLAPDPQAINMEAELLAMLDGGIARQVEISGKDVPTSDDLLELIATPHQARYSEDVGKDTRAATIAARRVLDVEDEMADIRKVSLAIEICCDRAIAAPGWDGVRAPPHTPPGTSGPADVAAAVSARGVMIVQAAFGQCGRLAKVITGNGLVTAGREAETAITRDGLRKWSERYPYAYGTAESDANRFYTSTETLRLTGIEDRGAMLFIGDKHLLSVPPNLIRIGDRFAGELQPMASAPSLTWLNAAIAAQKLGDGRRVAWISGADSTGTTLATLGDRTEETFGTHRFKLARDHSLPGGLAGASMAVVAAHGGLNRTSNAFQVVSDEGMLVVTADALGAALHNVGVVVLFVCSGGRSDAHPSADATLGLARQVLDQGAQAVVASPWPLESIVAPPWLEAFLRRWDLGDRLIEAVHSANLSMLSRWPHDHAKGLAMNILGNPLVRNDH